MGWSVIEPGGHASAMGQGVGASVIHVGSAVVVVVGNERAGEVGAWVWCGLGAVGAFDGLWVRVGNEREAVVGAVEGSGRGATEGTRVGFGLEGALVGIGAVGARL